MGIWHHAKNDAHDEKRWCFIMKTFFFIQNKYMKVNFFFHIANSNPKAHGDFKVCGNVVTNEKLSMDIAFGTNNMKFHLFIMIYE
jgi:hypothetical protein